MLPFSERRYTNPIADRRLLYTVYLREQWRYWSEAHQIYIRCIVAWSSLLLMCTDSDILIRFQMLVQRMQVVSVRVHYFLVSPNINWLPWQHPVTNCKNIVQIDHLHPKRFHMVKRLRKSVQYMLRYSTRYASFLQSCIRSSQMSSVNSGVTGAKLIKFLHVIEASFMLLMCTLRWWYPIHFGIPERQMRGVCYFSTKFVAMEMSLEIAAPKTLSFCDKIVKSVP